MEREESLTLLADALAKVLIDVGEDVRAIIQQLPADLHPDGVDVLASVTHFVDADIRQQDEQYKHMQETQMRELIGALRRCAARDELLKYSFLSW